MSIHQQGTNAFAQGQAQATVVNENSDEVQLDVRPSGSVRENIGKFSRDEADIAFIGNWELANLLAGNEPYSGIDVNPQQMFNYNYATWLLITNDESVETIEDLDGKAIGAGPDGAAVNQIIKRICDKYGVDAEFPSLSFGDFQGAFSEGVIDAAVVTLVNFEVVVPWLEQIMAGENTYVVEWPDGGTQIQNDSLISSVQWSPDQMPDFDRTPGGDYTGWAVGFFLATQEDVPESAVSAILNTTNENLDALKEANSAFSFHENMEYWTKSFYPDGDIHPAAEAFYQENGGL